MKTHTQVAIEILIRLKAEIALGHHKNWRHGICDQIERISDEMEMRGDVDQDTRQRAKSKITSEWRYWPHWSGSYTWPIPASWLGRVWGVEPLDYYCRGHKWEGRQLRMRLSLINFLLDRFNNVA